MPNFPGARLALGGVAQPLVQQKLRGDAGQRFDYRRLAQESEKVRIYMRTQDTATALERRAYTQAQPNT